MLTAIHVFKAPVLYAYYGRMEDFDNLEDVGVSVSGKIVLVRAGRISFAEKVSVSLHIRFEMLHTEAICYLQP